MKKGIFVGRRTATRADFGIEVSRGGAGRQGGVKGQRREKGRVSRWKKDWVEEKGRGKGADVG